MKTAIKTTYVKTTIELPETLMRRVKLRSVLQNQKLKETMAEVIESGLAETPKPKKLPPPLKPHSGGQFSSEEIDRWIKEGRR